MGTRSRQEVRKCPRGPQVRSSGTACREGGLHTHAFHQRARKGRREQQSWADVTGRLAEATVRKD